MCVEDAGAGQPSADLQRPGPPAAHPSRVAPAVNHQRLLPVHPAQGACRGASQSALFAMNPFQQTFEAGLAVKGFLLALFSSLLADFSGAQVQLQPEEGAVFESGGRQKCLLCSGVLHL